MVMQEIIPSVMVGLVSVLACLGLTIYLVTMPPTPQNQDKRMAVFMGVAALMGTTFVSFDVDLPDFRILTNGDHNFGEFFRS